MNREKRDSGKSEKNRCLKECVDHFCIRRNTRRKNACRPEEFSQKILWVWKSSFQVRWFSGQFRNLYARAAAVFWTWPWARRWWCGAHWATARRAGSGRAGADARGWRGMGLGSLLQTRLCWTADDLDLVRVPVQPGRQTWRFRVWNRRGRLVPKRVLRLLRRQFLAPCADRVHQRQIEFV